MSEPGKLSVSRGRLSLNQFIVTGGSPRLTLQVTRNLSPKESSPNENGVIAGGTGTENLSLQNWIIEGQLYTAYLEAKPNSYNGKIALEVHVKYSLCQTCSPMKLKFQSHFTQSFSSRKE